MEISDTTATTLAKKYYCLKMPRLILNKVNIKKRNEQEATVDSINSLRNSLSNDINNSVSASLDQVNKTNENSSTIRSELSNNSYESDKENTSSDRRFEPFSSIDNSCSDISSYFESPLHTLNNTLLDTSKNCVEVQCNVADSCMSTVDKNQSRISVNVSTASETIEVSFNKSTVGDAIRKGNEVIVPYSSEDVKKYACKYCDKLVSKLVPHITKIHTDIEEVKQLGCIPKTRRRKGEKLSEMQKTRLELIKKIRNMGSFKHNVKAAENDIFITARRPRISKSPKTVSSFAICPKCKGAYVKKYLHKHVSKCTMTFNKHNHSIQAMASKTLGNCHEEANDLYRDVLSRLRNDDVAMIARYDLAIVLFGNLECFKYRHSKHHAKMIRAKVRRLARLLLEMKTLSNEVTDFASILDPKHFDNYIKAVGRLGKYENDLYKNPHTPEAVGLLTKEITSQWIIECTKRKFDSLRKNAELFLFCFNNQFNKYVTSTVNESSAELKRLKKVKLPSQNDIAKLRSFLKEERRNAFKYLQNKFNFDIWKRLLETTLTSLQLFNRRRAGEIERLKIINFKAAEQISETTNAEQYYKLDKNAKEFIKKYSRILLRGKRNRTVPVLLDCELMKCIEMILEKRNKTKISKSNPYVFGLPSTDKSNHRYLSACDLMRKFAFECGADVPTSLRGTLLRKHIATQCISMNLSEHEIEDLANFMGHADKIHREHYRISLAERDILYVAKLLEQAQGIFYDSNPKKILNETDSESDDVTTNRKTINNKTLVLSDDACTDPENDYLSLKKKKLYTQSVGDCPRTGIKRKWDEECSAAVMDAFGSGITKGKFPSGTEIVNFLQTTPVSSLRVRTEPQVRSWLHKQRELLMDSTTPSKKIKRNTIPSSIYSLFAENIKNKSMPLVEELSKAYTQSPSLQKYSIQELQSMLSKAISE